MICQSNDDGSIANQQLLIDFFKSFLKNSTRFLVP